MQVLCWKAGFNWTYLPLLWTRVLLLSAAFRPLQDWGISQLCWTSLTFNFLCDHKRFWLNSGVHIFWGATKPGPLFWDCGCPSSLSGVPLLSFGTARIRSYYFLLPLSCILVIWLQGQNGVVPRNNRPNRGLEKIFSERSLFPTVQYVTSGCVKPLQGLLQTVTAPLRHCDLLL